MANILFFQELEFEYLGVMYISAALKKAGHNVSLIFINRTKNLFEEVKNIKPDFIAVSLMTGLHKNMFGLLKECKKNFPEIYNITGGPHPTFFPEIINYDFVDSVCLGEGEKAVVELIDSVIEKKYEPVNNVNYKITGKIINCEKYNEYISDLDILPFADREIYYSHKFMRDIPTRAVIAARGCPYRCT
ncbi:cobalamin-dependent protein, partial [Candidatus Dependentiae bacterium]|nr:cobalamin-dependent protein [Candidatus Dependentiae bacterium]